MITGSGTITTNGGAGQSAGWCLLAPYNDAGCVVNDGAAGGGAGGTVYIKVSTPNPGASLTINANGGNGGKAATQGDEHGPGGGGGGGLIFYTEGAAGKVVTSVVGGATGTTTNGSSTNGAVGGNIGQALTFTIASLPPYLQGGGAICYPELSTAMSEATLGASLMPGAPLTYTITVSNKAGVGNAGGVLVDVLLPTGITYQSVTVTYVGGSGENSAASATTNQGTITNPRFGNFVVAPGGSVVLTLAAKVECTTLAGIYNAHAQAYYLDPTRVLASPYGHISPSPTVFDPPPPSAEEFSASTMYASGGSVLGSNFNGFFSTAENVDVSNTLNITSNSPVYEGNTLRLDASIPDAVYTWTDPKGQIFTSKSIVIDHADETMAGGYTLTVSINGCSLEASVNVFVRGKIIVPNVFTPNVDGLEDTWKIQGLENYPEERTVRVFDIWGVLVFSSVGYKQPWNGTYNGRDLPVATYYYVVDPNDGGITSRLSGYVAIVR